LKEILPQGIELTALDESFRDDPYKILHRLRSSAPVHEDTELKRFIFTTHDEVKSLLRDKELYSDPRKANPGTFTREFLGRDNEEPSMLLMDDPDHRRLRSLVTKPFTPAAVEKWRPRAQAVIQRTLDDVEGEELELIAQYAGPIPAIVIAEMLGIDPKMHADFKRWSSMAVKVSFNPFPSEQELAAGQEAMANLDRFFLAEIESRRVSLGEDLISDMIRAEEAGEKLSSEEIVAQCNLLLVAGNVTTTDLIGNSVKALLDNPQQMRKLRDNPDLIKNAVEEVLRFDSPVTNSGRVSNRDFEVRG
jgi:cytochrome P450